jgi:hypothetical protein
MFLQKCSNSSCPSTPRYNLYIAGEKQIFLPATVADFLPTIDGRQTTSTESKRQERKNSKREIFVFPPNGPALAETATKRRGASWEGVLRVAKINKR